MTAKMENSGCWEPTRTIPTQFSGGIRALTFSPDGNHLMVGTRGDGLRMWLRQPSRLEPVCGRAGSTVTSIRFHPVTANVGLAAQSTGEIFKVDLRIRKFEEFLFEEIHPINALVFHPTGEEFLTGGDDGVLRVYDLETRTVKTAYDSAQRGAAAVHAVKYWPLNPKVFVTGGIQCCLKVWDSRVGDHPIKLIQGPKLVGDAVDLNGYHVLSGSYFKSSALQLWDLTSSRLVRDLPFKDTLKNGQYVTCARLWRGSLVIAGSTATRNVQIINHMKDVCHTKELRADISVQTFDIAQHFIAVGGVESSIKLYDLAKLQQLVQHHTM